MRIRLALRVIGLLGCLLVSIHAQAAPIHYTINFTATLGTAPTSGGFFYDDSVPQFTDFFMTWLGISLNLTGAANGPLFFGTLVGAPCASSPHNAAASFKVLGPACAPSAEITRFWLISVPGAGTDVTHITFVARSTSDPDDFTAIDLLRILGSLASATDSSRGEFTIAEDKPDIVSPIAASESSSITTMGICFLPLLAFLWHRKRQAQN